MLGLNQTRLKHFILYNDTRNNIDKPKAINDDLEIVFRIYIHIKISTQHRPQTDRHRKNLPAYITKYVKSYYKRGDLHNLNGPARINTDRTDYYIDGLKYTQPLWEIVRKEYNL